MQIVGFGRFFGLGHFLNNFMKIRAKNCQIGQKNHPEVGFFLKIFRFFSSKQKDLKQRGLLDETLVIWGGEFGRTPRIANKGGRNHWPKVSMAMLAGGGLKTGQMIGTTDRLGGYADSRLIHFQEVHATMHHGLGIDSRTVTVTDPAGRPQYLLDRRESIHELI